MLEHKISLTHGLARIMVTSECRFYSVYMTHYMLLHVPASHVEPIWLITPTKHNVIACALFLSKVGGDFKAFLLH